MSDLQCPATLLIVEPCTGDTAQLLAAALTGRNIAAVYAWPLAPAPEFVEAVGAHLRCATRVLDVAGGPAGDEPHAALQELADLHRGETVVVVASSEVVSSAVGRAAGPGGIRELQIDADGWRCSTWSRA